MKHFFSARAEKKITRRKKDDWIRAEEKMPGAKGLPKGAPLSSEPARFHDSFNVKRDFTFYNNSWIFLI